MDRYVQQLATEAGQCDRATRPIHAIFTHLHCLEAVFEKVGRSLTRRKELITGIMLLIWMSHTRAGTIRHIAVPDSSVEAVPPCC